MSNYDPTPLFSATNQSDNSDDTIIYDMDYVAISGCNFIYDALGKVSDSLEDNMYRSLEDALYIGRELRERREFNFNQDMTKWSPFTKYRSKGLYITEEFEKDFSEITELNSPQKTLDIVLSNYIGAFLSHIREEDEYEIFPSVRKIREEAYKNNHIMTHAMRSLYQLNSKENIFIFPVQDCFSWSVEIPNVIDDY